MPASWRLRAAVGAAGLLSLAGYAFGLPLVAGRGAATHEAYVVLYLGLFLVYLGAVLVVSRRPSADRIVVVTILGFGLLFRLAVLPSPVLLSSDLYRYLWDGRVQRSGMSPYRYPPEAAALRPLRDAVIYPHINRPNQPTVYPPGAEITFALVTTVAPDSIPGWRLFVLGCEALTTGLLLGLLRRMRVPPSAVLIYVWAPLAVFEAVQAGHVDFVMLPLLLLALGWRQAGRLVHAGVTLGLAVLIKLHPALLLLVWHRRGAWRFPAACAGVVAAGYAAHLGAAGLGVVGFLPKYFGSAEDFNIGLRLFVTDAVGLVSGDRAREALGGLVLRVLARSGWLDAGVPIERLLSPEEEVALRQMLRMPSETIEKVVLVQLGNEVIRGVTMCLLLGALAVLLVWIGRRRPRGPSGLFYAGMAAASAYLVLVPTALHAWYAAWILPFLAVYPSPAWLWFTGTVPLSYLKYAWDPAGLPLWVRLIEFLPLYALLIWEWRTGRGWAAALTSGARRRSEPAAPGRGL